MKSLFLILGLCLAVIGRAAELQLDLWPSPASAPAEDKGSMTVYLPDQAKAVPAGVLVVPGGSFLIRCEDHEGTQVARWLNRQGLAAFVVHYRLIPRFTMREELDDVRRAVQVARSRAAEFGVQRLGIVGFSAGAYLAGEAALKPWAPNPASADAVQHYGSALDFMALVYGAPGGTNDPISGFNRFFADQVGLETWRSLTATTLDQIAKAPPAFMFCTVEDRGAARRMGEFHLQLLQQGASSEAHFFASGPHGVGLAQSDPVLGEWPRLFHNWMKGRSFLSDQAALPVAGVIKVNGQPLELGYVVFTPRERANRSPSRTAYVFNRSGEKGAFRSAEGLEPGTYDAVVYQMAAKWNSVWAEPLLNRIQSKLNKGEKLAEDEVKQWKDWAGARHYQATLPDLASYPATMVEVSPANASHLSIEISSARAQ